MNYDNPMREPQIVKCVVNIGVGQGGEQLRKGFRVIEMLTGQEPVESEASTTNADFGIRKNEPIACKVTLRGDKAEDFLKEAFWVKENTLYKENFDDHGNFSFGISDYTEFEGMSYNPNIGIFGMDISVELARKGVRVKKRKKRPKHIPEHHQLSIEEAIEFIEDRFDVEVLE
ncbi:MAG: 50S ribosomal protein L5 [Thermoplasmatota archaeon]